MSLTVQPFVQPPDAGLALAQARCEEYSRLENSLWRQHNVYSVVSSTLVIVVPFVLSTLLLVPERFRVPMNIASIVCSGTSAIFYFVPNTLRLRERAYLFRKLAGNANLLLTKFQCGVISQAQLLEGFERLDREHQKEDAP
jgi:hypothetical protein